MQSLFQSLLITLAIAVALIVSVAWSTRSVQHLLGGDPSDAASVAARIASGDLTASIDVMPGDESSLLAAIKKMRDSLRVSIRHIQETAGNVASAAREITEGNRSLSSRTDSQAASLEETAANMEEITVMLRQTADHAGTARSLASAGRWEMWTVPRSWPWPFITDSPRGRRRARPLRRYRASSLRSAPLDWTNSDR